MPTREVDGEVKTVVEVDGVVDRTGWSVEPSQVNASPLVSSKADSSVTDATDKKYVMNV